MGKMFVISGCGRLRVEFSGKQCAKMYIYYQKAEGKELLKVRIKLSLLLFTNMFYINNLDLQISSLRVCMRRSEGSTSSKF